MTASATTGLDAEELLHLALAASNRNEAERAIALLKQAIDVDPGHAKAHYMLGAEHAQIGLFDRAMEEMQRAIVLDPELDAARFQLGLLQLTSKQVEAAQATWQPLERLGAEHYFVLFKTGLEHLARDEFDACLQCLRRGIASNQANGPLNVDMERMAKQVQALVDQQSSGPGGGGDAEAADDAASGGSAHLLVNAYTGQRH